MSEISASVSDLSLYFAAHGEHSIVDFASSCCYHSHLGRCLPGLLHCFLLSLSVGMCSSSSAGVASSEMNGRSLHLFKDVLGDAIA